MQVITVDVPNNIFSSVLAALNHNFSVSALSHYIDFYSLGWVLFFFTLMIYILSKEQWMRLKRELQAMAMNDHLTDLPNHRLFEDRANQLLKISRRKEKSFALVLADLDDFKVINETMGHYAGDIALREVSERLMTVIRGEDTVARLGGDEFGFLIQDVRSREDIEIVFNRILAIMADPVIVEGEKFKLGISMGVAFFPNHSIDVDGLLRRADIALYRAKEEQQTYQIYHSEFDELLEQKSIGKHCEIKKAS